MGNHLSIYFTINLPIYRYILPSFCVPASLALEFAGVTRAHAHTHTQFKFPFGMLLACRKTQFLLEEAWIPAATFRKRSVFTGTVKIKNKDKHVTR